MSYDAHPELLYQIALSMAPSIGPITARKLIRETGSARKALLMTRASLENIPSIGPRLSQSVKSSLLLEQAEKEMAFLDQNDLRALYYEDPAYPVRLRECEDAPILIYVRGGRGLDTKRALSVVGTRRASSYGKELCRSIVLDLSQMIEDLVIISGLAYGIDVMAHRAALEAGIPTVAVLGHGLQTLYPNAHRATAEKISANGALISDFHSGMKPERNNFLRRNRIIAGLADATLVVESAASGGALITAAMASSYQRDVLAVPGRATDDRSRGCNRLIKDNVAAMVESARDIIRHLNWDDAQIITQKHPMHQFPVSERERQLLELMDRNNGLRAEELSTRSGIPIQHVLSILTEMELKQWVYMEPGNFYQSKITPA